MFPDVSAITGISFVFTFLVRPVSIVRHLHFGIFSDSLLITFLPPEIVAIDKQVHSSSRFMISDLLLGMVLLVCACWCHNTVTLLSWFVSTVFVRGHASVQCQILPLFPCFIIIITFTQSIYNYMPETTHISRVYSVAGVLYLQFVLHVMLLRPRTMFCTFTVALSITCM